MKTVVFLYETPDLVIAYKGSLEKEFTQRDFDIVGASSLEEAIELIPKEEKTILISDSLVLCESLKERFSGLEIRESVLERNLNTKLVCFSMMAPYRDGVFDEFFQDNLNFKENEDNIVGYVRKEMVEVG
ncbi:MAG TPA: hypothetical protein PLQ20_02340 [Candidatus Paceibacterota bacterium]|nr:hypothetical protein [Candidatus Paceibacterota bacterium]